MGAVRILGVLIGTALGAAAAVPAGAAADAPPPATVVTAAAATEHRERAVHTEHHEHVEGDPDGVVDFHSDGVLPPDAYVAGRLRIRKWPGDTIRYWVDAPKSFDWAIDKAVQAWNDTGLDMRFVETSKAKSQLTIKTQKNLGSAGLATVGYTPVRKWRWAKLDASLMGRKGFGGGYSYDERRVFVANIAAHELGHTLGLGHRDVKCGLMGPVIYLGVCPVFGDEPGHYACRVVDEPALDSTVRLYGGRRTLAPDQCPMDPLPPALHDVTVSGGGEDGAPAVITWDPPPSAPAGTQVEVVTRRFYPECTFPLRGARKVPAHYADVVDVKYLPLDDDGVSVRARDNETPICIGVRAVNRSRGGGAHDITETVLYLPVPPSPTVHWVRKAFSDSEKYTIRVDLPVQDDHPLSAYYGVGPEGACPTAFGDDWLPLNPLDGVDHLWISPETFGERPCFSVVSWEGRPSEVVTYQVGVEPPPGAPVLGEVTRDFYGQYELRTPDGAPYGHDLLVLTRPTDGCAPTTWPAEESKYDALTWYAGEAYQFSSDLTLPCLTFYLVDGLGRVGPGVTHQVPPAPAPATPVITSMTTAVTEYGDSVIRFHVTYDAANTRLVGIVAPTGQCATDVSYDGYATTPWELDDGSWELPNYEGDHPCVSLFAVNADGVHSAAATRQL